MEEFIIKNVDCIINFNSRFEDYLPLTINSITILREIGLINIDRHNISFNNAGPELKSLTGKNLGSRIQDIFKANEFLSDLMKVEKVNSFYLKLRIAL